MTAATAAHTEQTISIAGRSVRLLQGGNGPAVVFIHHSIGNPGWVPLFEQLATKFSVTVPDLPGYGQSERPEWAREPRDIAILANRILDKLDLRDVTLVGAGLGGFIAAEMAVMNSSRLKSLVLVGAAGLQPEEGEIMDQMIIDFEEYAKASFKDDAAYEQVFGHEVSPEIKQLWDYSREMSARITWKPYMFSRRLANVLGEIEVPATVVHGTQDHIVPVACAHQYVRGLANAKLELIEGAGHSVDLEAPEKLAAIIATAAGQ